MTKDKRNAKRCYSGFAQFPDAGKRDEFVRATLASSKVLSSHAYLSGNGLTIVFDKLTGREQKKILSALSGLGTWVEDVQFRTLR